MFKYIQWALIIGVVAYVFLAPDNDGVTEDDIDLNAVLDVTLDTLYSYQDKVGDTKPEDDALMLGLAEDLQRDYNNAMPALYTESIGVAAQTDASLLAYEDKDRNSEMSEGEEPLFLIEIDGENSRIIASSRSGAISDHRFSGTSLVAGYLIGSMLGRQRAAGVNTSRLANTKPVSSKAAARSRAGSGSHSKGK